MRKLVLLLAVLLLVGGGCAEDTGTVATEPPEGTEAPAATGEVNDHGTETFTTESFEVALELDNFYFEPTFIKSPGDATATVRLTNEGTAPHTFTVDALEVDEEIQPGESRDVTVSIGTETRYEFYCRFHADQGMRGAFQPH